MNAVADMAAAICLTQKCCRLFDSEMLSIP